MPPLQQRQPQFGVDTSQGNPVQTFGGTFMESLAGNVTLGAWNPDIIPEHQEQLDPWATTAGRVAGSIAGFIGSLYAIEAIGGLVLTSFGAKIYQAGKAGKVIGGTMGVFGTALKAKHPASVAQGMIKSGTAFSIHDVAQEYIHQIREQDPDSYALAQKAFGGFITGGMFGMTGQAFKNASTLIQVPAGASTMAFAETLDAAVEGRDITKEDIARSMLIGGILSGVSSIGWKKRAAKERLALREDIGKINTGTLEKGGVNKLLKMYTGHTAKELGVDFEKSRKVVEEAQRVASWSSKRMKYKADTPYFNIKTGRFFSQPKKVKGKIVKVDGKTVWEGPLPKGKAISGMQEKEYRDIISTVSKGRTTSTKQITRGEAAEALEQIQDYAINNASQTVKDTMARLGINPNNLPKELSGVAGWLTPKDRAIITHNWEDLTGNIDKVQLLKKLEQRQWGEIIPALKKDWDIATKTKGKARFKATIRNQPTDGDTILYNYLTGKSAQPLTKEQKKIADEIRQITDMFFRRENEALVAMGLKPIEKVDHYLTLLRDRQAANDMGRGWNQPAHYYRKLKSKTKRGLNPTTVSRVEKSNIPELVNPWKSLQTMINYDLKDIYLHKPRMILEDKLTFLTQNKIINHRTADDMREYIRVFIFGEQTPGGRQINTATKNFLEKGMRGKLFEKIGREVGYRPVDTIANTFGQAVTQSFIAFRPQLALRNLMQVFYGHGLVSTKNLAKGMGEMPAELKKILDKSPTYLYSVKSQGIQGDVQSVGQFKKASMESFSGTHGTNVTTIAKASYHQAMDYVTLSKYKKLGWADKAGIDARAAAKKAGNNNWRKVVSATEKEKIIKEIEFNIVHSQFLYDATGMPGLFRNPLAKMAGKLTSYPINYTTKYIPELWNRLRKGSPGWDKTGTVKLPMWQRRGLFKHFFIMGGILAGMEKAGFDYSQMLGITISQEKLDRGSKLPIKFGVWNVRPSPALKWLSAVINIHSENPHTAAIARNDLHSALLIPGRLAIMDIQKAKKKGSYTGILFKERYERPRKKKKRPQFGTSYKLPRAAMPRF